MPNKCRAAYAERGQAMVEFAIMLIVFMALCTGMLYVSRLLSMDYWAQQESRYVAFEQTWAPRSFYGGYTPAFQKFEESQKKRQPRFIKQLDLENGGLDLGGLPELVSHNDRRHSSDGTQQSMLASIWQDRTTDWIARSSRLLDPIPAAFAAVNISSAPDAQLRRAPSSDADTRDEYEQSVRAGLAEIFEQTGFGGRYCSVMARAAMERGVPGLAREFTGADCASAVTQGFAGHLARTIGFRDIYRDMAFQLESGFEAQQAVEIAFEKAVAQGFYSFFDQTVNTHYQNAPDSLSSAAVEADGVLSAEDFSRVKAELRYLGSTLAIDSIGSALDSVSDNATSGGQTPLKQQQFEAAFNQILHAKVNDADYLLPLNWLPVPPTFKPVFGNLFDAVMNNVLSKDEDLRGELVENSNRFVSVNYLSKKGFSKPYTRRWDVRHTLTARFFLVTEPWHITRRVSATGPYRELGDENDSDDDDTDEGILRRRVFGLYLFPSRMFEMVSPLTGLIPGIDAVTAPLDGADFLISTVKDFILDNPLQDVAYFLQELPLLSEIDFTFPRWPAVRPQAYPATDEIRNDKLTIFDRTFADYIEEQKDNNPPANPVYHDDDE